MKEGIGYYFYPNGKVYCGQFRQDNEEGVGEYIDSKNQDVSKFKCVDSTRHEIIKDKLYKVQSRLKSIAGVTYTKTKPKVII